MGVYWTLGLLLGKNCSKEDSKATNPLGHEEDIPRLTQDTNDEHPKYNNPSTKLDFINKRTK